MTKANPEEASRADQSRWHMDYSSAWGFQSRGEQVFPGILLVARNSPKAFPVGDEAFDPQRDRPLGIALWGASSEWKEGMVNVQIGDELDRPVPYTAAEETERPLTGVGIIDAWTIRAAALRSLRRGTLFTCGSCPLNDAQLQGAITVIERMVREGAHRLIERAPSGCRSVRLALAKIADESPLADNQISNAICELIASAPEWKAQGCRTREGGGTAPDLAASENVMHRNSPQTSESDETAEPAWRIQLIRIAVEVKKLVCVPWKRAHFYTGVERALQLNERHFESARQKEIPHPARPPTAANGTELSHMADEDRKAIGFTRLLAIHDFVFADDQKLPTSSPVSVIACGDPAWYPTGPEAYVALADAMLEEVRYDFEQIEREPRDQGIPPTEPPVLPAPLPHPRGWLKRDLLCALKHIISATTFDSLRRQAGVASAEPGGSGQQRRYTKGELLLIIDAARKSKVRTRAKVVEMLTRMLAG